MTELIPTEIIPLVWFAGIAITVYFFFRKFSTLIIEKLKQSTTAKKRSEQSANTDDQIDNLINNAPRILHEIDKQIAEQKAAGVDDTQMKGLYQKKQLLSLVADNQEVINIIGKPIIKKLLSFVRAI